MNELGQVVWIKVCADHSFDQQAWERNSPTCAQFNSKENKEDRMRSEATWEVTKMQPENSTKVGVLKIC